MLISSTATIRKSYNIPNSLSDTKIPGFPPTSFMNKKPDFRMIRCILPDNILSAIGTLSIYQNNFKWWFLHHEALKYFLDIFRLISNSDDDTNEHRGVQPQVIL